MLSKLEKDVLKFLLLLLVSLLGCRISNGWFAWSLVAVGCWACIYDKGTVAITCFVLVPSFIYFSPELVGEGHLGAVARIGQNLILFSMLLTPATRLSSTIRKCREDNIPLGWLFVYVLVAIISSANGWMPLISYLKILNFVLFLLGVIILSRVIQASKEELYQMRVILLGLAIFIVVGSIFAYFIPSVGYSIEVNKAAAWGMNITGHDVAARAGRKYFNGLMNHSQMLACIVPLCLAWVLCDMLFIERQLSRLHLAVIIAGPILMYLSRSRIALLMFFISILVIYYCCISLVKIPRDIKHRINGIMYVMVFSVVVIVIFAQIRNKTLSRWIRKEDNLETDYRSVGEALTASRMSLVEYNLNDFKLNPMLGKGFQVMSWHDTAYRAKQISLLSAPIEKGVLPLMLLGETGVVGTLVFVVVLFSFYKTCIRRQYRVLLCLFTTLMVGNMAEASFFSPGGSAMQWTIAVIGGFSLDLIVKRKEKFVHSRSFEHISN